MRGNQIFTWGIAVLIAAATVGLLHALIGLVNPLLGSSYFDLLFLSAFCGALAIAVILGVPAALLYRSRGWNSLMGVLIGGFLIGILPYCLFFLITFSPEALSDFSLIAMFGGYGAFGALIFWLILRKFEAPALETSS